MLGGYIMKNSKKKQIFLTLVAVLSLVLITVGVSYSLFTYSKTGVTDNIVKTGRINFLYTEVSGIGKGISLTDAFPISDEEGKLQTGEGKVFDFKITSTIEMNSSISYEVTARKKSDSTLDEDKVKLYLTEVNGNEQEILLDKYSSLPQTNTKVPDGVVEKTIYEGEVSANTSNYEKNFRLRMWLDNDTDFSIGNMNNKTFTVTVNVYANGKVVDDTLDSDNTLKSLSIDNCTLSPEFSSSITEYACTVASNIESVNIMAEVNSSSAKLNGTGTKTLTVGENSYQIRVIAENGTEKVYNIKITRREAINIFGKSYEVIEKEPTLTTSSNNTNDESGLYKSTLTNTGEPTYYFRGNVENNYVSFAGYTWRIVRVNEDGTIRIIMQDGINNNATYVYNSNYSNYTYMYYSNSAAKSTLENWYSNNIGNNSNYSSHIVNGSYFCEEAKTKYDSNYTSGSASMTLYSSYTPNFKCKTDGNGKGQVSASIGLITYDETVFAGGYYRKNNFLYYLYNNTYYWTMSPGGFQGNYPIIWGIYIEGYCMDAISYGAYRLRPVLNLKADTLTTGDGTGTNPFIIIS